jgi:parvulin-like peptidyl-prolyl isomerase
MGFSVKGRFGELEEVIDKLEQGEVSDIIPVEGALMIIKVDYVHPGGVLPFELVQKEIIHAILSSPQRKKPEWCEYLAKLRTSGRR